jgi:hypothetical protein
MTSDGQGRDPRATAWTRPGVWIALGASLLFACLGRVETGTSPDSGSEDSPGVDSGDEGSTLDCPTTERFYNGSCRPICSATTPCAGGLLCMAIDATDSVCLPYAHCSYLGDDSQCFGTGTFVDYNPRWGMEVEPYSSTPPDANPYDQTPYVDPYFEPSPTSPYPNTTIEGMGCQGDAQFVKLAATGDVACGGAEQVTRCRQLGDACVLVQGTTAEIVSP